MIFVYIDLYFNKKQVCFGYDKTINMLNFGKFDKDLKS